MFYYLIHSLPWGRDLQAGKRNVRTFIIGSVFYILLHGLMFANKIALFNLTVALAFNIIKRYFWWIFLADGIAMSVTYKIAYGRNILTELPLFTMINEWIHPPPVNIPARANMAVGIGAGANMGGGVGDAKNKPIINQKDDTPIKTSLLNRQLEDELDIDLLTENESLPDANTLKQVEPKLSEIKPSATIGVNAADVGVSDVDVDDFDDVVDDVVIDDDDNVDNVDDDDDVDDVDDDAIDDDTIDDDAIDDVDNDVDVDVDVVDVDDINDVITDLPTRRLTSENIDKYVIKRNPIKLKPIDADIKSEDLNL